MNFKINWIEVKQTSTGKTKADVSLIDESGTEQNGITIWGDFPNFADLKAGSMVEGDVVVKQSGQYTNRTLYPTRTNTMSAPRAPAWAKTAVTEKNKNIVAAQERKDESIQKAAIRRDATLLTVAVLNAYAHDKIIDKDDLKKDWQDWKKWLEGEYEGEPF